jgi:hypothetical protein
LVAVTGADVFDSIVVEPLTQGVAFDIFGTKEA